MYKLIPLIRNMQLERFIANAVFKIKTAKTTKNIAFSFRYVIQINEKIFDIVWLTLITFIALFHHLIFSLFCYQRVFYAYRVFL